MKILFITLIFIGQTATASAQDTYFKTIQLFGESYSSGRVIKADKENVYFTGNTLCTTALDSFSCMFVAKLDFDGNVQWENRYNWSRPANDRSLSIKGDTIICNGHVEPNVTGNVYHLLVLDSEGDSLHHKRWDYTQFDQMGVYSNGHVRVGDDVFMYGQTRSVTDSIIGIVQKYNLQDESEATFTYNTPIARIFPGFDMQVDVDSNLVVLNEIYRLNGLDEIRELLKMDRNGNVLSRVYGPDYENDTDVSNQFVLLDNGNYFYLNSGDHFTGYRVPQVISMAPDGVIDWRFDFPIGNNSNTNGLYSVREIIKAENGDVLLTGVRDRQITVPEDGDDIFIMRVSPEGETLWRRYYNTVKDDGSGDYNTHWASDIQELSDGSILVMGGATHHDEIVLIRVDADGCLADYNCEDTMIVGIEDNPFVAFPDFPDFYPNPTDATSSLDLDYVMSGRMEVYTSEGQLVQTTKLLHQSKLELDLASEIRGLYFVHIYNGTKLWAIKKVVKH